MRIIGFSQQWPKLQQAEFTTFRFPRKDRDWERGEKVQVRYKPRSPKCKVLGIAEIVAKAEKLVSVWSPDENGNGLSCIEAIKDGFVDRHDMLLWLTKTYGPNKWQDEPMNKLTLRWLS